ncbi:MAG TPA: cobalamin B12-binding domain-containing protein [Pseudomonadales bacterium]|nr:cobalamin B12-binding domain-containing protein [Pseudomonadales bacterium]
MPRLLQSHNDSLGDALRMPARCSSPESVRTLAEFVATYDLSKATALLDAQRADGATPEVLLIEYLAPAARYLGDMWHNDQIDFTTVTIGVGRLQTLTAALAEELERDRPIVISSRRALLAPVPGDQHTFGVSMVASFMRRDGWDVAGGPAITEAALIKRVRTEHFDVLGLGIGAERWATDLDATVARLRNASRNKDLAVLIGGPLPTQLGLDASDLGADALVVDAREASTIAQGLLPDGDYQG